MVNRGDGIAFPCARRYVATDARRIVFPETGRYPSFHLRRLESIIQVLKGFLSTPV